MSRLLQIMLHWTWECRYLFNIVILFPLDKYAEVKLLGYIAVLILIFWGSSILFSVVAALVYILTLMHKAFPFFSFINTFTSEFSFQTVNFNSKDSFASGSMYSSSFQRWPPALVLLWFSEHCSFVYLLQSSFCIFNISSL